MKKGKSFVVAGVAVLVVLVLILFVTSKIIILGGFTRLEAENVRQDMNRVLDALSNELVNLESAVLDWSNWDESCAFVADGNAEYVRTNLPTKTFSSLNVSCMIFMDSGGRIVFGMEYEPEEDRLTPIPESLKKHLDLSRSLVGIAGTKKGTAGLIVLPEGPMLVSAQPILTSEGKGPRRGTVVFGRFLDTSVTEKLSRITHIKLKFFGINDDNIPTDIRDYGRLRTGGNPVIVRKNSEESISGFGMVKDIYGDPALIARVDLPRTIYQSGKKTIYYFMAWITCLVVASFILILMLFKKLGDITDRKRMEKEMLRAQKLESLGVLAGGIAHDFNNLLTGILGNISLARMHLDPGGKAYERLEGAEKASERARDLTQQLLTFSKGGAPVRKTASITQLIMDSAGFVLRGSNVRCDFSLADDLWPVSVDQGQISRVINNLVINACQSMPDGGTINVCGENYTTLPGDLLPLKEGRCVRISISDQGMGISEENLQKIFDPYFTTKQKGSGLGLATVYSILKNHDGYVEVESKEGTGTVFTIYLPASENVPEVEMKSEEKKMPVPGMGRILVMDDDEMIREIASEILHYLGYDVVVCGDGSEAVDLYRVAKESEKPFNAVIMDLTVAGGMGGREAMVKLLEIDPQVKGIVSSGYSNDPILARYRDYGFCAVMAKPYNVENFTEIVQKL